VPAVPGSLAATTDPSGRRISTRRISPVRVNVPSWPSSAVTRTCDSGALSKSVVRTWALTKARVVAASLPTTSLSVAAEKWAETMIPCAVAVIPTSARNAPYTSTRRNGRRRRGELPNTGGDFPCR
jgi:hypothetical protein